MKVVLIDIDSTIPNLALHKISKYHKDKGDEVIWNNELFATIADKIYVSCVFDFNKPKCYEWEGKAEIGGSGYDRTKRLPKEIEYIKPRINYGFTTRGCIRKCSFCIVPEKEGYIRIEGDIYDIWDGKSKEIVIMDNNILALPDHFQMICRQIRKEKLKVDFNQGLDHRLLNDVLATELLTIKHIHEIRFAFDHPSYEKSVLKALGILKRNGLKDWGSRWYVYIGEKDTYENVFNRMELLRQHKQLVYVMRDKKVYDNPMWIALASWGNTIGAFKMDWDIMINSKRIKPYKKYFKSVSDGVG